MKVVPIVDAADIPAMLRKLAADIESGEVSCERISLVAGFTVACYGPVSGDVAAEKAIFDFTYGIHAVMGYPVQAKLTGDI